MTPKIDPNATILAIDNLIKEPLNDWTINELQLVRQKWKKYYHAHPINKSNFRN